MKEKKLVNNFENGLAETAKKAVADRKKAEQAGVSRPLPSGQGKSKRSQGQPIKSRT